MPGARAGSFASILLKSALIVLDWELSCRVGAAFRVISKASEIFAFCLIGAVTHSVGRGAIIRSVRRINPCVEPWQRDAVIAKGRATGKVPRGRQRAENRICARH
jgi:hypothetical protein